MGKAPEGTPAFTVDLRIADESLQCISGNAQNEEWQATLKEKQGGWTPDEEPIDAVVHLFHGTAIVASRKVRRK